MFVLLTYLLVPVTGQTTECDGDTLNIFEV